MKNENGQTIMPREAAAIYYENRFEAGRSNTKKPPAEQTIDAYVTFLKNNMGIRDDEEAAEWIMRNGCPRSL